MTSSNEIPVFFILAALLFVLFAVYYEVLKNKIRDSRKRKMDTRVSTTSSVPEEEARTSYTIYGIDPLPIARDFMSHFRVDSSIHILDKMVDIRTGKQVWPETEAGDPLQIKREGVRYLKVRRKP